MLKDANVYSQFYYLILFRNRYAGNMLCDKAVVFINVLALQYTGPSEFCAR